MERASSEPPGPVRALAKGEPGREEPPDRSPWAVGEQANAGQPPAVRTAAPPGELALGRRGLARWARPCPRRKPPLLRSPRFKTLK